MPISTLTLLAGNQFDGTVGNGRIDFVPFPSPPDDRFSPRLVMAALNTDRGLIDSGRLVLVPEVPDGGSDAVVLQQWDVAVDAAISAFLTCGVPVPWKIINPGGAVNPYHLELHTSILTGSATFTVWYTLDRVGGCS